MIKLKEAVVLLLFVVVIVSCKHKSQYKKMDTIELSDGSFIECKSLSFEEFEELKANVAKGPLNEFKQKFNAEVYELPSQEVIANESGYYMLFNSLGDVSKVLLDAAQQSQGVEVLSNKNPFGKDFPSHVDELIKGLTDTLGIEYVEPDEHLLQQIDTKLVKVSDASKFKKTHFLNFIAVIGKVLNKKHKTDWEMILSSDGKTWSPYLKSNERPIEFFTYLYEDIYSKENTSGTLLTEIYQTVNDIKKY